MKPLPVVLTLALLLPALGASGADGTATAEVVPFATAVDGETAHGLLGVPAGEPRALVLILHGYGHQAESHRGHLLALAERGALGVAMDYRGPVDGFPLANGAADSCAAFVPFTHEHPDAPTILFSVSMGAAVAALVLQECPVFDHWVISEGLSMLHETWAGAAALSVSGHPTAVRGRDAIEEECGGTPAQAPLCYADRSAAIQAAKGVPRLQGAYLTHGLHDGLVPYNHGREMVVALRAAGVPSDFYTVVRGEACQEGTTLTGYLGVKCTGFAGHGTESNDAHTLTALSFGLLYDLVDGVLAPPADREIVVDRELGTLP